jgi:hypothetical protein
MVYDYFLWRDDMELVRQLLPDVRTVMQAFHQILGEDGLMGVPEGWNFTDFVPGWENGTPPKAESEPSGILNLHFALCLGLKAEMEAFFGETKTAAQDRSTAANVCAAVLKHFWNEERGLIADDLAHTHFSEHAQCLALLSGLLPEKHQERILQGLLKDGDLARTTIYFTHYLFETYYRLGYPEKILERLSLWFDLEKFGFKTTLETLEPSRSDCHAWGAHPVYHYYASFLGIRPDGGGFRRVRIAPQLGTLSWAEGTLPHPQGQIQVSLRREPDGLQVAISLPPAVGGIFVWQGKEQALKPGKNNFKA